jgi:hypothetical protein
MNLMTLGRSHVFPSCRRKNKAMQHSEGSSIGGGGGEKGWVGSQHHVGAIIVERRE